MRQPHVEFLDRVGMSELTAEIVDQVIAACQANAGEAASTIGRTFGGEFTLTPAEAGIYTPAAIPAGPGLALLFTFGDVGCIAVLSESTGFVPDWCANPDLTGQSKLSTLAQELSMQLLPDSLMADKFEAARVEDLSAAITRAGVSTNAALVPLTLTAGGKSGTLDLIWPITKPGELFDPPKPAKPVQKHTAQVRSIQLKARSLNELPSYSRSLLKITVPVRVVLAEKRESVQDVVELAPGTIIKFSKSCDESLHLYVGDQVVAAGEAVKVGDKFGFRVTGMELPDEHFLKIRGQAG
jgi:flagellar motor switch protein FliN/FliY